MMNKLKIIHMITGLGRGGAERMLFKVAKEMTELGHVNTIICLGRQTEMAKDFKDAGIEVIFIGGVSIISFLKFLSTAKKIIACDVLQGWMYHANLATLFWKVILPWKHYFWNIRQGLNTFESEKASTKFAIRLSGFLSWLPDKIVFNSMESIEQHVKVGFKREKAIYIPNGFSVVPWDKLQEKRKPRETKHRTLLHVSRFHPDKDQHTLIKAFVEVARVTSEVDFFLVGRGLTKENKGLLSLIPNDILGRFQFVGEVDSVEKFYLMADVFVLTSVAEGFPNVIGEAMSYGVPCVATNVGECARLLGDTGWIVAPRNLPELKNRILEAIKSSDLPRSRKVWEKIENEYSLRSISNQYLKMYAAVL